MAIAAAMLGSVAASAPQVQVAPSRKNRAIPLANGGFLCNWGYFRHQNGSTPKDRRASVKQRNKLRAKGHHRKAVR